MALPTLERDLASFVVVELVPDVASRARVRCSTRTPCVHPMPSSSPDCHLLRERLDHNVTFVAFDERLVVVARESGATVLGVAGHGLKRR